MTEDGMELACNVENFLNKKTEHLASHFHWEMKSRFSDFYRDGKTNIESPIEQIFFIEWHYRKLVDPWLFESHLFLFPQYQDETTGKFRVDFKVNFDRHILSSTSVKDESPSLPRLGIELDGHEWHEKTKEQVQDDKQRERHLIRNGWTLLRFTGSEVIQKHAVCIYEVIETYLKLKPKYKEAYLAYWKERGKSDNTKP